jgi:hypothetical protein
VSDHWLTGAPIVQLLVFALTWFVGAFGVYGLVPIDRRLDRKPGALSAFIAFGASTALVVLATVAMYVNWWFGVRLAVHAALLGIYVLLGVHGLIRLRANWIQWGEVDRRTIRRRALLLACVLVPALLIMAPAATTPYIYGDDDAYHVSLLRYWFQEQQLDRVAFHSYFVFPLLSSAIAALFVPITGLQSAKLVQLAFVVTAALGIYGVVLLTTGRQSLALIAAFLYETLPVHFMWAFAAMADRATGCLMTLGVSIWLLAPLAGATVTVLASALLLAAATAVKQQGAFALVGLAPLVWIASRSRGHSAPQRLALAGLAVLVCAFVLLPWYGRAYWITGNATFPMRPRADDTLLTPAQRQLWSGSVLEPDLTRVTTLIEQLYAYSTDRFNDATNPALLILLPVIIVAALYHRDRFPRGTRELVSLVVLYLLLLALMSLFFAPGVRVNRSTVWSAGRYRTFLYPAHGSLFVFAAVCCAAVGLRTRGTRVLAAATVGILLAQTVNLTAYLRWAVPPFVGLQSSEQYLAEFHSLGEDLVTARQVLSDRDRIALDRHRTQINVPGHIVPTTRLLGEVYSTTRTLAPPATCAGPGDLKTWLVAHRLDAIVTSTEPCPAAAHWPRDAALEVTVGRELVIARLSRK